MQEQRAVFLPNEAQLNTDIASSESLLRPHRPAAAGTTVIHQSGRLCTAYSSKNTVFCRVQARHLDTKTKKA
jgi:hypothetical protein